MSVAAAEAGHLLAMAADSAGGLSLSRVDYSRLYVTLAISDAAVSFFEAGSPAPVAMAGVLELPERVAETWFLARRGGLSLPVLLACVRCARRVFAASPMPVICCVLDDNTEGQRLARLAGFEQTEAFRASYREWRRPCRSL